MFHLEEILATNSALWFSSAESVSKKLAYASFDDTEVGEVSYNAYGGGGNEFQEGSRDSRYSCSKTFSFLSYPML